MDNEYVPAHKQTDTTCYSLLKVVGGVLVTQKQFWAKDDSNAGRIARPFRLPGDLLVHVVEE